MPETREQRQAKGLYTMAELKAEKKAKTTKPSGPVQGPAKPKPASIEETFVSTAKANPAKSSPKPAAAKPSKPAVKKMNVESKPLAGVGSRQVDSPTGFRTSDFAKLDGMAKNFNNEAPNFKKNARKVGRSIDKQERVDNRIERTEARQKRRANTIVKRESKGLDASVERSNLSRGAKRLNKLRNK
jgi:hypothetical protein